MREFKKTKVSTLMGETEVRFTQGGEKANILHPFSVIADRQGIRLEGHSDVIENIVELKAFAKVIDQAQRAHESLKPKITIAATQPVQMDLFEK